MKAAILILILLLVSACSNKEEKSKVDPKVFADQYAESLYPGKVLPKAGPCTDCQEFEYNINTDKISAYVAVQANSQGVVSAVVSEGSAK